MFLVLAFAHMEVLMTALMKGNEVIPLPIVVIAINVVKLDKFIALHF
jgi:hypothetical protein